MPKTVNRRVQGVNSVDYSDMSYQFQNISTPSGINESKNFVAVDQNSLADAENVYIDEDGLLSSRPAIKPIAIQYISNDTKIVDIINVNGIIFYHMVKDDKCTVAFKYNNSWNEHSCSAKLTIAFIADMFVFFTTNDIFAYTTDGQWKGYADIFYIPVTVIGSEYSENSNIFVDGNLTKLTVTDKTNVIWSDYNNESIRVIIDGVAYSLTFKNGQQITFTRCINTLIVNNYKISKKGNILAYNTELGPYYYSADGTLFHELPQLPFGRYTSTGDYEEMISSSEPIISESGGTIFALAKFNSGTSIYYIDTATHTEWKSVNSTLHPLNKIVYTPTEGTYQGIEITTEFNFYDVKDTSFNRDRLYIIGTIGCSNDDDRCVFISLPTDYDSDIIKTTTTLTKDDSTESRDTDRFRPAYVHTLYKSASGLVMNSYCVIIDSITLTDSGNIKPLELKLSTDATSGKSAAFICCISNNNIVEGWTILFDENMKPFYKVSETLSNFATGYPVMKLWYALDEYSAMYPTNPHSVNMYRFHDSSIEMHIIQENKNKLFDIVRVSSIEYSEDVLSTNFYIDADVGTHEYNVLLQLETDSVNNAGYTTDTGTSIIATEDLSIILTDKCVYLKNYEKAYPLLHSNVYPISANWNGKLLYSMSGQLYSNDWSKPIYIEMLSIKKYNLLFVNHFKQHVNDFIAIDNKLYFRTVTEDKLLYFSKSNEYSFESVITNLVQLSQTTLGVFLKNAVYIITYEGVDSNSGKPLYTCVKSKLQLGCRDGDDVLLTYDGSTVLLPTLKGLTALSYEQLMLNNEQVYTYLSEQLSNLYEGFADGNIKLYQYKSYIVVYSSVKKYCYLYDLTNQSWWKWSSSKILSKIVYSDEALLLLINGNLFTLNTSGKYLDFNYEVIDWHFISQKLHFGAPNNYKHIYAISLESSTDTPEDVRYSLKCVNYRKSKNVNDAEIFEYNINGIRLYVKRCNYYKSNAFQFELASAYQEQPRQMKLANIAIKYRITESIR